MTSSAAPVFTPAELADAKFEVDCQECDQVHSATYSHPSQWRAEQAIFEVICTSTPEWYSDFYTDEVVRLVATPKGA